MTDPAVVERLFGGRRADTVLAVTNIFCPTGKGGGIDPTCKAGADRGVGPGAGGTGQQAGAGDGGGAAGREPIKLPKVELPEEVKRNLENNLNGPLGGIQEKVMTSLGVDPAALKEMHKLFDQHRWGGEHQASADKRIAEAIRENTPLGHALRTQVALENEILKHWEAGVNRRAEEHEQRTKKNMKEAWEYKWPPFNDLAYKSWEHQWRVEHAFEVRDLKEPMKFYRKGGADKDVLPTSTNSEGAQSHTVGGSTAVQPHFRPDNAWTSDELRAQGYLPLGGLGYKQMGYSGEDEVTWIKVK